MKAILKIPEENYHFEFENITINQYRMIAERPSEISPFIFEKYPVGKPITLMTSNMPEDLRQVIDNIISDYCNQ